ncbi:hypothetical protein GCM10025778_24210 [Paeniglutamicibacter antarcticus]|uniref:Transposase DDE domain-containing protein n=1 Tax=Paeniglutamicibacter antarcticus TaxID=494023 RepID=A0ABP9TPV1_9MICC
MNRIGIGPLQALRKGEKPRLRRPFLMLIESINDTLKGQLDPYRHGAPGAASVTVRVLKRLLAMTLAIWHNE